MAGLRPTMLSRPKACWSCSRRLRFSTCRSRLAERALHGDAELVHREVLRQVVEGALLDGGHRRLDGGEGGDHDHGQRGIRARARGAGAPCRRCPGILRSVRSRSGPLGLEQGERADAVGRGEALVPGPRPGCARSSPPCRARRRRSGSGSGSRGDLRCRAGGRVRTKVVPSPGRDSTSSVPLWSRTIP